jgi:poly(A) polymerase
MLFLTYQTDIVNSLPSHPSFVYPESVNKTSLDASLSPAIGEVLSGLREFFVEQNIESYLVGGMVRNLVMHKPTADVDIAVAGDAISIGQEIAASLHAHCVVLDAENNVVRLLPEKHEGSEGQNWQIDIASLQGDLASDLGRRDFTIDAMAIDMSRAAIAQDRIQADIIDPLGGLGDIDKKLIRAVSPQIFQQDAIRLLRAIRIGADLGFAIEQQTATLMRQDHDLIRVVAGERVREELLKIFALSGTYGTIVLMDELGLLMAVFPEMEPSRNFDQAKEHNWDVLYHSLRQFRIWTSCSTACVGVCRCGVISGMPWISLSRTISKPRSVAVSRRAVTKLAALLHDVAKPQTKIIIEAGGYASTGIRRKARPSPPPYWKGALFQPRDKFHRDYRALPPAPGADEGGRLPAHPRAIYRYFRDLEEAAIATLYFSLATSGGARAHPRY